MALRRPVVNVSGTLQELPAGDTLPGAGVAINAQTGTTYTFVASDSVQAGTALVTLSNASAVTATVPPNSSVAFAIGDSIDGAQIGAGQVTLVAGSGVTLNGTPGLKCRAQYSGFTLIKTATNTWLVVGDLSA